MNKIKKLQQEIENIMSKLPDTKLENNTIPQVTDIDALKELMKKKEELDLEYDKRLKSIHIN